LHTGLCTTALSVCRTRPLTTPTCELLTTQCLVAMSRPENGYLADEYGESGQVGWDR
jgi:hypothetical protein